MKGKKIAYGLLLSCLLFFLYYFICPIFFASLFKNFILSENYWISNLARLAVYLFTFLIIILIVHKDLWKQFKEFKNNPRKVLKVGLNYWFYGIVVMAISNIIATSIVGGIATNEKLTRQSIFEAPIYMIPTIIIFGPVLEEIIFRYALRKSFSKKWPYVITSALIFGALHIISGLDEYTVSNFILHLKDWVFIIPYGALGFFFAKAYYETDNIFASIIPHILHNSWSVFLIILSSLI